MPRILPRPFRNLLPSVAILGALVGLAGCEAQVDPRAARAANARNDMMAFRNQTPDVPALLTEQDAVTLALTHNLEAALADEERKIREEAATRAAFRMIPSMEISGERSQRNRHIASSSVSIHSGNESLEPSYSTEKDSRKWDLSMAWNLLDFGISYFHARQEDDRFAIQQERVRRLRQNLALQVREAYWEAAVAKTVAVEAKHLVNRAKEQQTAVQARMEEETLSRREGLERCRKLLGLEMRLSRFETQWHRAKAELTRLMGLPVDADYEIVGGDLSPLDKVEAFDLPALESEALQHRPEMFVKDLEERISVNDVRIATLRLLPSASFFARRDEDNNDLLYYNSWYTAGLKASWNLLALPEKIQGVRMARMETCLERRRRMALAVGILAQLRLAALQYGDAFERYELASKLHSVQEELSANTALLVREGKMRETDLLDAEAEALLARAEHLNGYADVVLAMHRLDNTLGRHPVTGEANETDPLFRMPPDDTHAPDVSPPAPDMPLAPAPRKRCPRCDMAARGRFSTPRLVAQGGLPPCTCGVHGNPGGISHPSPLPEGNPMMANGNVGYPAEPALAPKAPDGARGMFARPLGSLRFATHERPDASAGQFGNAR